MPKIGGERLAIYNREDPRTALPQLEKQFNARFDGLLDFFYPVGCYFETSDAEFNPNKAWGGKWELETEGLVHIGAGENYEAGDTGGSKDAVVVSHHHLISSGWSSATGTDRITYGQVGGGYYESGQGNVQFIQDTGVSGTDKNMQPYVVVNRWHRIS